MAGVLSTIGRYRGRGSEACAGTSHVTGGDRHLALEGWEVLVRIYHASGGGGLNNPDPESASSTLARGAEARNGARKGSQSGSPDELNRWLSILRRVAWEEFQRVSRDALAAWRRFEDEPEAAEATASPIPSRQPRTANGGSAASHVARMGDFARREVRPRARPLSSGRRFWSGST